MSLRGNSINRAAKLETSKYFKSQKYVKAFPSYHSDVSPLKPFFFFLDPGLEINSITDVMVKCTEKCMKICY